jgi:hypothetical protein
MKRVIIVALLLMVTGACYADNYVVSQLGNCTVITDTSNGQTSTVWKM